MAGVVGAGVVLVVSDFGSSDETATLDDPGGGTGVVDGLPEKSSPLFSNISSFLALYTTTLPASSVVLTTSGVVTLSPMVGLTISTPGEIFMSTLQDLQPP